MDREDAVTIEQLGAVKTPIVSAAIMVAENAFFDRTKYDIAERILTNMQGELGQMPQLCDIELSNADRFLHPSDRADPRASQQIHGVQLALVEAAYQIMERVESHEREKLRQIREHSKQLTTIITG